MMREENCLAQTVIKKLSLVLSLNLQLYVSNEYGTRASTRVKLNDEIKLVEQEFDTCKNTSTKSKTMNTGYVYIRRILSP